MWNPENGGRRSGECPELFEKAETQDDALYNVF